MRKKPIKQSSNLEHKEYSQFLQHIKTDILQTQLKAALSVTTELTLLYWRIGKTLSEKISTEGWGAKIVETLAHDLGNSFPEITGFSRTNIYRMIAFYTAYPNCPTAVGQIEDNPILTIPWGHNITILEKIQDTKQRLWYAQKAMHNGWSRASLGMWIESDLYSRQGKAITNFKTTLPEFNSDLAEQTLKDPYYFDFLTISEKAKEREVELGLVAHIQKLLLELGQGFAFIGRQVHLNVGNEDYYLDLLFYHVKLHCFFVVELKTTKFKPEYAGKIAFYLSAIDATLKTTNDNPTIGLLLCKSKDKLTVEYALRENNRPIGVASFATRLVESLPKELKNSLPTIAEIEAGLEKEKTSID